MTHWRALLLEVVGRVPAYLKLGWALARSPAVPRRYKLGLLGGALYAVSPLDLVPGVIPVLGQLDDLAILLRGIRSALRHCPGDVADELLRECGLTEAQLDQDLEAIGEVAKEFSRSMAKSAWQGSRAVGKAVGRGLVSGARAVWDAYRPKPRRS